MRGEWYRSYGKRILDSAVAISGLLLFSSLLVLVAVLVRLKLGSPVLFRHQRAGLQGRPFTLYKFRSMTNQRDAVGRCLLPDAQRLTPFGRLLRSSSLDELSELIQRSVGKHEYGGPTTASSGIPYSISHIEANPQIIEPYDANLGYSEATISVLVRT